MYNYVKVKFVNDSSLYVYDSSFLNKNCVGKTVLASSKNGIRVGTVISFFSSDYKFELEYSIIRLTNRKDYLQHISNIKEGNLILLNIKKIASDLIDGINILDSTFNFDRSQLIIRFISDSRVDFRDLAKKLGGMYKTRIELRQIGIRDKAKEIGGIGPCGRMLCCSSFLSDFDSISINMAKNQSLSLNPSKINGVCGRLLCCLKFEDDIYKEMKNND